MGLIDTLRQQEPETWHNLHTAAQARFHDGLALAISGEDRRLAAIYLFGYAVELLLKSAFFRILGFDRVTPVDLQRIKSHQVWIGRTNLHNLVALRTVLIEQKKLTGHPYDPVFAAQLAEAVGKVSKHWAETLRYKHGTRAGRTTVTEQDLSEVDEGVRWLLTNQDLLWS